MNGPLVRTGICVSLALLGAAPMAAQQAYPNRQIELIVPFVAGGTTDTAARMIGQRFTEKWGQTVIISNRPGGGSSIGTNIVAKSPPDGYTLLITTLAFTVIHSMQKQPYDPIKDFEPITEISSIPLMLVVHPSLPVKTLPEFIAYAKAQPDGLDYATSGAGTSTHLAMEMLRGVTGAPLVHVPFKGNAEVMNSLLGGHVKAHFGLAASSLQHVRTGALRVLAVSTEKRHPALPDTPTVAELGYPGFEMTSWQGALAPAGTPKEIVAKLNAEMVALLHEPAVKERIAREGADAIGNTVEQFTARVRSEVVKWEKVVKAAGLAAH
jgi:tripartite-type tricarboxylate transporter receptor subunit TctC